MTIPPRRKSMTLALLSGRTRDFHSGGVKHLRGITGMTGRLLLCGTILSLGSDFVLAQIEETVVIGTRIPGSEIPQTDILDRESVAAFGTLPLTEILSRSGKIYIDTNAGTGSINTLTLRGGDPNFTQIQIDGVPVNDATNSRGGAYDLSFLNSEMVESVEILPASASAYYGSQAIAGVININTRKDIDSRQLTFAGSSIGGRHGDFLSAGDRYLFSAYYDEAGEDVTGSEFTSKGVFGGFDTDLGENGLLNVGARYQKADAQAFPDDSGGDLYAVNRSLERREPEEKQFHIQYRYTLPDQSLLTVSASHFEHDESINTPSVAPGLRDPQGLPEIIAGNTYRSRIVGIQYLSPERRAVRLSGGIETRREEGSSAGSLDFGFFQLPVAFDLSRETVSAFLEGRWRPTENLSLTLSGRYDDYSGDSEFSPGVRISQSFLENRHHLFLSWGEGYKQPSFYALGHPLIGNPDLLPESSDSWEAGYLFDNGNLQFSLSYFDNRFTNLVDFDAGPPPRLVNRERVDIDGVELKAQFNLNQNVELGGFYTTMDISLAGGIGTLRKRPEQKAGLGVTWRLADATSLHAFARHVSSQLDSSIPTGDLILPGFTRTDLSLSRKITESFTLTGSIDNIGDTHYENSVGNPLTGRIFRLTATQRL